MKLPRKLFAPALALSALFCGAAVAQDAPKPALPDAPVAQQVQQPGQLKDTKKLDLTPPPADYRLPRYDFTAAVKAPPASPYPFSDGKIGRLAGYFDRHSNDSQYPFDFAMEYKLTNRFTLLGGTLTNMETHSGKYWSDRFVVRQMTGLPDWQTTGIRNAMFGSPPPDLNRNGNDGYGVGIKIFLGHKP